MHWADLLDPAIGHHDFERNNVIGGRAVNWATRTGRIIGDHSTERCAGTGCDIRAETKSVRLQKIVELIQHNASADMHAAFFKIDVGDLPVVARKIDD